MRKKSTKTVNVNKDIGTFLALLLVFAIGVGLSIWGVLDINRMNYFKNHGIDTTGRVVDYDRSTDEDDDEIYYAIYEYYADGERYTVKDSEYSYDKPIMGKKHVVYYDPENPSEAITDLEGSLGAILLVTGLIFGFAGLAFMMAQFNMNESVIHIILGVVLVLMGFGLPVVIKSILVLLFTGIFGVLGVVIVIKAITKLTGNEGGAIDQAVDSGMEQMGQAFLFASKTARRGAYEHGATIQAVSSIVKGIIVIVPGCVFALFGLFMFLTGSFLIGGFIICFGGFLVFLGVKSVKEGLRIRKEAKMIEQENEV